MDEVGLETMPGATTVQQDASSDRSRLLDCLDRLLQAGHGYEFILLRETPIGEFCLDEGDLDFLGHPASVDRFIERVDALTEEFGLHFRVIRATPRKTNITVWSRDLRERLDFDLWVDLWQVDDGRLCLHFDDVRRFCAESETAVLRMVIDLEFGVYLQHLRTKRKDVRSAGVRERLRFYAEQLAQADHPQLAQTAQAVLDSGSLGDTALAVSKDVLERFLGSKLAAKRRLRFARRAARSLGVRVIRAAMPFRAIALVGTDGAGKTTIGEALALRCRVEPRPEYVIGKSLYRESRIFRVIYGLSRRSVRIAPMRLDELFAGLATVVAATRLIRRLRSSRGRILMFDRYLPDFLYLNRKSDRPRFSLFAGALRPLCVAMPVVHLSAPYESVMQRKGEVTEAGLRNYNDDMRAYYCSRLWIDYLRMRNGGTAEAAVEALARHLDARWESECSAVVSGGETL